VDDVGTEVGHQRPGQRPSDHMGELDDLDPVESGSFLHTASHLGPLP
jgi:hypothetical protein